MERPEAPGAETRPACPGCGCEHAPVLYTRHSAGSTIRRRECRHCGRRFTTRETVTGDAAPRRSAAPSSTAPPSREFSDEL